MCRSLLSTSLSRHLPVSSSSVRKEPWVTLLPSLCFGPSVHASGRQGQGPARFLVPLVNRGPVARRASSVGTAHSVHSLRLAAGVMRGVRNVLDVILPSHHGPSPSLPAEPLPRKWPPFTHLELPSLRSGVSLPFPLRPYATPFVHFGHSVSSLVMLSPPFGHGAGTGTEPKVEWTERKWEVEVSEPRTGINLSCHSLSLRFVSHGAVTLSPVCSIPPSATTPSETPAGPGLRRSDG